MVVGDGIRLGFGANGAAKVLPNRNWGQRLQRLSSCKEVGWRSGLRLDIKTESRHSTSGEEEFDCATRLWWLSCCVVVLTAATWLLTYDSLPATVLATSPL